MAKNNTSDTNKAKNTFIPTLNIGLGGTGTRALLRAKLMINKMYGEIPPYIKFLALDTTTTDFSNVDELGGTTAKFDGGEVLHLSVPNVRMLLENQPHIDKFVPGKNKGANMSILNGSGQVRSNGRIALFHNYSNIKEILRTVIESLRSNHQDENTANKYFRDSKNKVIINVVCSIAGGTGSGMFLDIPFIIHSLGILEPNDEINAYLVLPEIYISGLKGVEKKRLRPNAYGALKELDFLSYEAINKKLKIQYNSNRSYSIEKEPYKYIFLIDNQDHKGINIYTKVDEINDFLGACLYLSGGAAAKDLIDAMDNMKKEDVDKIERIRPIYSGMGLAEIYYDGESIANIFVDKLIRDSLLYNWTTSFKNVADISKDMDEFLKDMVIREEDQHNELIDRILSASIEQNPQTPSEYDDSEIFQISTDYIKSIREYSENISLKKRDEILNPLKTSISEFINKKMFETGGISYCRTFIKIFTEKCQSLKTMMDTEAHDKESGFEIKVTRIEEDKKTRLKISRKLRVYLKEKNVNNYGTNSL